MFRNFFIFIVLLVIIPLFLNAQDFDIKADSATTRWRLVWDPNIESDMSHYKIFRDVHPVAVTQIDTVNHSFIVDSMQYIDGNLELGILYYYRLKAVDSSGLESNYSSEVNAAIPKVSGFPNLIVRSGKELPALDLNNYITDPDNPLNELTLQVEKPNNISFAINGNILTFTYLPDEYGIFIIGISAFDLIGFHSGAYFTITILEPLSEPTNFNIKYGD